METRRLFFEDLNSLILTSASASAFICAVARSITTGSAATVGKGTGARAVVRSLATGGFVVRAVALAAS